MSGNMNKAIIFIDVMALVGWTLFVELIDVNFC